MGRTLDQVLQVRCDAAFLKLLDDWRRKQPEIPSRPDAVRRLVRLALERDLSDEG